jgi:hypothetical protein
MKIISYILTGLSLSCALAPRVQLHDEILVGNLSRQQIEDAFPLWKTAKDIEAPSIKASKDLALVPAGAEVSIYLGTWCGDSRRELSRLWRALDILQEKPAFAIHYVGVDRQKKAPALPPDLNLRFVPTFVVSRDGHELGRIVESSPHGIEYDLKSLILGEKQGVISKRIDLAEI